jgi:type II secretory pathway pseudopilin PulG
MATRRYWQGKTQAGYSVGELTVVLAIVGVLSVLATPFFLSYYQASRLRVGAEEVAAYINQGRQLAIKENIGTPGVCVHIGSTALQYGLGSCTTTVLCAVIPVSPCIWLGPGTDTNGNVRLPSGITLTTTADPIFTYLGNASPGGTVTVTNTQTSQTLHVSVALSGRVSIGP